MSYIDNVKKEVEDAGQSCHLSNSSYVRILDTPHVWGYPFGKGIMSQACVRQAEFERAIVEIVQKTKYRCDISSLNSPDPDWAKAIIGAMDTCLSRVMGRKKPTQFRFLFGQTPTHPIGEPDNYKDFKAALIRLFEDRSSYWEVKPEIWMGRFYRIKEGVECGLGNLIASHIADCDDDEEGEERNETDRPNDTKMTWNHTKIISMDGVEALVGGHNLNMDLFRSYPPVHDVSVVVHGDAAYGAQLFLNNMWRCGTDLLTKEMLDITKKSWINQDKETEKPEDPLVCMEAQDHIKAKRKEFPKIHNAGSAKKKTIVQAPDKAPITPPTIREQDLQTLAELKLEVFEERITYDTYDGLADYKQATRILTVGKYWDGPSMETNYKNASEIMKEELIKTAKHTILMSQMDIVSTWKKNWSDHTVCQWLIEALRKNKKLKVQIVVSPLDAGAGAEGDQYSFGSGASRTFELLKYYMTHDKDTDKLLKDSDGSRADALKRLYVAPLYYTDKVPKKMTIEGKSYIWPACDEADETYEANGAKVVLTKTLKQRPLSEKPPVHGIIGSALMSVWKGGNPFNNGVPSAPGNHAKIMIVDNEVYVVGSDNLYPGFLSEINYLVEGKDAVNELIESYWKPLWEYSGPHAISGNSPSGL